jgi:hypothetical protein
MATTQQVTSTSTPTVNTSSRQAPTRKRRSRGSTGGVVFGPLILILGLWLKSHFGPTAAICNTGLGAIGQAVSSTAAHDCTLAGAAVTFGEMFVWFGGLMTALCVIAVIITLIEAMQSAGRRAAR